MMGEMYEVDHELGRAFRQNFRPMPHQQEVYDVIDYSNVGKDKWLHIKLEGGVGSGKTYCAIGFILRELLKYPGCRALGVRRTTNDIKKSIWLEVIKFLDRWGIKFQKNESTGVITLPNNSQFWVISDLTATQAGKDKSDALGSTEFSFVLLEEADSISKEFARTVVGRLRQNVGVQRKVVFYLCNPPNKLHWLYKMFNRRKYRNLDRLESRFISFRMNPDVNTKHVGEGYVEALKEDWEDDEAFLRRNLYGLPGADSKGPPIYGKVFVPEIHIAKNSIIKSWDASYYLKRGWDFGFNRPAVVISQIIPELRQWRIYAEIIREELSTEEMAEIVKDFCNEHFPEGRFHDYCDPAGDQSTSQSKLTDIDILKSLGIHPQWRKSSVSYGVGIIREQLRTINGKGRPAILIDPSCEITIEGLELGYCNNPDVNEKIIDPLKDGYFDHPMDCLRYIAINCFAPGDARRMLTDRQNRKGWVGVLNGRQAEEFAASGGNQPMPMGERLVTPRRKKKASYNFGSKRNRRF